MDSEEEVLCNGFGSDSEFNADESADENYDSFNISSDKYSYEILSTEDIVRFMENTIKEVNSVVALPATTTRILLNHFKWDKEILMEKFFDDNQDKLFEEAHIVNPFKKSLIRSNGYSENVLLKQNSLVEVSEECQICYTTLPFTMMTGLECGHRYCQSCWSYYLTSKIMEEGIGQRIPCAAQYCDILVDDATVMRVVKDSKVKLKYQQLITNSFVECNRLLRWCSTPDCNSAIKVQYVAAKPVTCRCKRTFCFECAEDWHDPITCNLLKKWLKKFVDDLETRNWISRHTKNCPNCSVHIEKTSGCNHIICQNRSCGVEFCWICLSLWDNHDCNVFKENNEIVVSDAKFAVQRYLFYSDRYVNHLNSLRLESKFLSERVKRKMEEIQQDHSMSWIEVQFLINAVDILCSCRQTLMYTYAFAYYLKNNNQSTIFEYNQKDLENAVESLSGHVERYVTEDIDLVDMKQKLQDKYKYCESRRKVLLDHVHEGYEREIWEYAV